MIYDCILFYDEFEMLELRMNILDKYVDKHVLTQSNRTFQGETKDLVDLTVIKEKVGKFGDKVILNNVDGSQYQNCWSFNYENFMRDSIKDCLIGNGVKDDDIIILSEVDEIPDLDKFFEFSMDLKFPVSLGMNFYYYYFDCKIYCFWNGCKMFKFGHCKDVPFGAVRHTDFTTVKDMGWHFSYTGGPELIRRKLLTGGHTDLITPQYTDLNYIMGCMKAPKDLFDRGYKLEFVKMDDSYPKYLLDNIEKYKHLFR